MATNIVWHQHEVDKQRRGAAKQQKPCVIWLTGLSGSGKSTIANLLEKKLAEHNKHTYLLDGDNVRHGLCGDLGFSDVARRENIRRIGEVSKLFVEAGVVVLTAFISPFREDRAVVRGLHQEHDFIEVHCAASLAACENRDVKGLYKRARQGEIKDFTGISSPYESPEDPEVYVNTGELSLDDSVEVVLSYLKKAGVIS